MSEAWKDGSRYNGRVNGVKIKDRGFHGIIARSSIGTSGNRDPEYHHTSRLCSESGLGLAAYGVNWPINHNPELEAEVFAEQAFFDPQLEMQPEFLAGDFELGSRVHKYGHHTVSGEELVEQAVRYMLKLEELVPIPLFFYTARWHWNDKKLLPYIGRGETAWHLWTASYPLDPRQIRGFPPRYSKDELHPNDINSSVRPVIPEPWRSLIASGAQKLGGWQWTSKGRGKIDGYCLSTFFDRNVLYVLPVVVPGDPPDASPAERIRAEAVILRSSADELDDISREV